MTPGAEDTTAAGTEDQVQDQQPCPPAYEPPALVALGNVHSLLAGTTMSPAVDSNKVSHRSGG
jgi:hypothetical protein